MSFIIFDEENLCLRNPILESDLCGRDPFDVDDLCTGDDIDTANLRVGDPIDSYDLCALNSTRIDVKDLCTIIGGSGVGGAVYRADTTLISADNEALSADYAL